MFPRSPVHLNPIPDVPLEIHIQDVFIKSERLRDSTKPFSKIQVLCWVNFVSMFNKEKEKKILTFKIKLPWIPKTTRTNEWP